MQSGNIDERNNKEHYYPTNQFQQYAHYHPINPYTRHPIREQTRYDPQFGVPVISNNDIALLQTMVGEHLNSLDPHKKTYEKLTNAFKDLYKRSPYTHDQKQLNIFMSCLWHIRETLDGKQLHIIKSEIADIMIELDNAARHGQADRIIPIFEKLLTVLNKFQDSLVRNLQVQEPDTYEHETHLLPRMMQNLLNDQSLSPALINGIEHRNYPSSSSEFESKCHKIFEEIKSKTSKLRAKSVFDEKENIEDIIKMLSLNNDISFNTVKNLQNKFHEATESYLLEMRRLTRSPEYLIPVCFNELSSKSSMKLFSDCCSKHIIPSYLNRSKNEKNFNYVNNDLPHILVYISNIVYHAHDKYNEAIRGTMSKLLEAKISAVEQLIKSISPNLSEDTRGELALKILNEICPQRWHSICEQALNITFGNAGLTSIQKLEEPGGKTTINKSGRLIIVEVPSRWAIKPNPETLSLIKKEINPDYEFAIIKTIYKMNFFTSKTNNHIDEVNHDHCGHVKLNISVSNFKQKHPHLFLKTKLKLNEEKQLIASLLSGTFEAKPVKKLCNTGQSNSCNNLTKEEPVSHVMQKSEPAFTKHSQSSYWQKNPSDYDLMKHHDQPVIGQRSKSTETRKFGENKKISELKTSGTLPEYAFNIKGLSKCMEKEPRRLNDGGKPYISNPILQNPDVNYGFERANEPKMGSINQPAHSPVQQQTSNQKGHSWPRSHYPQFELTEDNEVVEYPKNTSRYYPKPPAPGMETYAEPQNNFNNIWCSDENLPMKNSLGETLSKSDINYIQPIVNDINDLQLHEQTSSRTAALQGSHRRTSSWTGPSFEYMNGLSR